MQSFYLRYRPQKTKDLDLEKVREFFAGVLSAGRFSHAYLFAGPRGAGKTSAARILAQLINCDKNAAVIKKGSGALVEPDGTCASCKKIQTGSSLSVLEIDAASNRGIDDIRALRERIGLAPAEGSHVVYIVDEVHMLTTEAFNALLKTLEEPPQHAVFVLCTTEPDRLPDTILSRCVRVQFTKASAEEVTRSLQKVIKGEKIAIEPEALELLAESVDGSFRDGMKLLEQVAGTRKKITRAVIENLLGQQGGLEVAGFYDLLMKKDAKAVLTRLGKMEKQGADFAIFTQRLTEFGREKLLEVVTGGEGVGQTEIVWLLRLLSVAMVEIKTAVVSQLPLEIAAVEFCLGRGAESSEQETEGRQQEIGGKGRVKNAEPVAGSRVEEVGSGADKQSSSPKIESKKPVASQSRPARSLAQSLEEVEKRWSGVLSAVRPHNHSLEALLRACRPKEYTGKRLTVEVFYQFHKEQLEQERHRRVIEDVISEQLGTPIRLSFELGKKAAAPKRVQPADENVSGAVEDEALAKVAEEVFG